MPKTEDMTVDQPKQRAAGFTIVETMIVLAVTGLLFLSVMLDINGKQANSEFQTSVNNLASNLRQISGEVTNGYFPPIVDNSGNNKCDGATDPVTFSSYIAGSCVYVGKALYFPSTGNNFWSYTVVAPASADAYNNVSPVVFAGDTNSNVPSTMETKNLEYGLTLNSMNLVDSTGTKTPIGSFAFVQSLNSSLVPSNNTGASQHPDMIAFTTSPAALVTAEHGGGSAGVAAALTTGFSSANKNYTQLSTAANGGAHVVMCFQSGTTNQWVTMSIGVDANQLSVTPQIVGSQC